MTVELYKTRQAALSHSRMLNRKYKVKTVVVRLIYNPDDGPNVGMYGFTFTAKSGKTYYTVIDSKEDLPIFESDVYSVVLGIVK
jgi:hypothetical protein